MENVMTNGFTEMSLSEMEALNGGTDRNEAVHDLFYVFGQGAGYVKNFAVEYWDCWKIGAREIAGWF